MPYGTSQTAFFDHTSYPSVEWMVNSDFTATQLWHPIAVRIPGDGGGMFSETSVLTISVQDKVTEGMYNVVALFEIFCLGITSLLAGEMDSLWLIYASRSPVSNTAGLIRVIPHECL
jgi:hypothetical protein